MPQPVEAEQLGSILPAPAELLGVLGSHGAKKTSYLPADLLRPGEAFEDTLPHQRVAATAEGASFTPAWEPANPAEGNLSFAFYSWNIPGYAGDANLYFSWLSVPADPSSAYFAFANWDSDRWDWYVGGADRLIQLPGLESYLDSGGRLVVCVLRTGLDASELDWLRLGSIPPTVVLSADTQFGLTPLAVNFDASGSTDPDGSIVEYRWDPEGDGDFSQSTGTNPQFSFEYSSGGEFSAAVRAIDNDGIYNESALTVKALDTIDFSFGAPDVEEEPTAMLVDSDQHFLMFGKRHEQPGGKNYPFFFKVSPMGTADFAKTWNMQGGYTDAVFDPDGNIYACGYATNQTAGGLDAMVQKWTPAGQLLWSKSIGTDANSELFNAMLIQGDSVFACGRQYVDAASADSGFVARLDLSGNLIWSRTLTGPYQIEFNDIAAYWPITFGTHSVRIAGNYWPSFSDTDCLYAEYDLDGNLLACKTWGDTPNQERGQSISTVGQALIATYVSATIHLPGGDERTMLGRPGGVTVEITHQGTNLIVPWALQGLNLVLAMDEAPDTSAVVGTFSSSLDLLTQTEISAAPNGSCSPCSIRSYGPAGLAVGGLQYLALPSTETIELEVQPSAISWVDVSPTEATPSQVAVNYTLQLTSDLAGMEFDRAADDGDAFVYLYRYP